MTIHVTPIPKLIELVAPAYTLGVANAAGAATTAVPSNSTLLAFDTTLPAATSSASSVGVSTVAPRRDHVHAASVAATQAEEEAGSSTTTFSSPGRQQFHPSAAKLAGTAADDGTLETASDYNVTSVSKSSTGVYVWTIATDFSASDVYQVIGCSRDTAYVFMSDTLTTGTFTVRMTNLSNARVDTRHSVVCYGDQ